MVLVVKKPSLIKAAGNKPKEIREYFGRVNTRSGELSLAKMNSPAGWEEPGQCPEFDEYTVVTRGTLVVKTKDSEYQVSKGEAILVQKGEWIRYSTPYDGGAEYYAICMPAFSPETVHRDNE